MAKIKNVSGEHRYVPALGGRLVMKGQEVDLPEGAEVFGYTCQTETWAPADEEAQAAHDAATAEPDDLTKLTKPQLVEYASVHDIAIDASAKKAEILDAILAAETTNDPALGGQED